MEARLCVRKISQWESLSCTSTLAAWHLWGVTRRWLISDSPRYADCWLHVLMFVYTCNSTSTRKVVDWGTWVDSWVVSTGFVTIFMFWQDAKGISHAGFISWLIWRSAYLTRVVSWRNRFYVAVNWGTTLVFGRDNSRIGWTVTKPMAQAQCMLHASCTAHFLEFNLDFVLQIWGWSVRMNYPTYRQVLGKPITTTHLINHVFFLVCTKWFHLNKISIKFNHDNEWCSQSHVKSFVERSKLQIRTITHVIIYGSAAADKSWVCCHSRSSSPPLAGLSLKRVECIFLLDVLYHRLTISWAIIRHVWNALFWQWIVAVHSIDLPQRDKANWSGGVQFHVWNDAVSTIQKHLQQQKQN